MSFFGLANQVRRTKAAPAPTTPAPGEWSGGVVVLPEKESEDGPRFGQVVVGAETFSFTSQLAGAEIGRAVVLAQGGEGAAAAALQTWAVERGGLPAALRLCWRKCERETAEALAVLLAPHAEEISAQVVTERRKARKQRKRVRPGLPVLAGEVVDAVPLLPGVERLALNPAPSEGNSVMEDPLPPGWVRAPRIPPKDPGRWQVRELLNPSAGCPSPWE